MRGGGERKGGGVAGEDDTLCGGPEGMLIGRRRSGGGVRLRPVSGIRGAGGGVLLMEAVASGAPVLVLEAVECGRRAKICLARVSFYGMSWQQYPVSFHLQPAWRQGVPQIE